MAPKTPPSPFDKLFQPGDVGVIRNLQSHQNKALNGKFARAIQYEARLEAWACLVDSDVPGGVFKKVYLKYPDNLGNVPKDRKEAAKKWAASAKLGGRVRTKASKAAAAANTSRVQMGRTAESSLTSRAPKSA